MAAEPLDLLWRLTLCASVVCALLLLARRPVRSLFGARVAYALWLALPVVLLAALLPAPATPPRLAPLVLPAVVAPARSADVDAGAPWEALLWIWLAGAMAGLALDGFRQRRFVRQLGALEPRGEVVRAAAAAGPVVVGVWRPRIVVPCDFEQRFDAEERALILAHERVHVARRDLAVNLLAAALRRLQWFNPLLHLAFLRFRQDQELAADALVLQSHPRARRRYAEAMLKAQSSGAESPLGCQWQPIHPLKERLLMLHRPLPGTRRVLLGLAGVALCGLSFAYAAWAAQPAPLESVDQQATYARLSPPKYPKSALQAGAEGKVLLELALDAKGGVQSVEVSESSGHAELDAAAVAAVETWRFNPAQDDGRAVATRIAVPVQFALDGPPPPAAEPKDGTLDRIDVRAE